MLSPLVGRRSRRIVTSRRPCSSCSPHRLLALRMRSRARQPRSARRPPTRPRPRSAVTGPRKLQLHRQHPLRRSRTRNGPLIGRDRASQSRRSLRCMTPAAPGPMRAQGYEESLWSCTSLSLTSAQTYLSSQISSSELSSRHESFSRGGTRERASRHAIRPSGGAFKHELPACADCHTVQRGGISIGHGARVVIGIMCGNALARSIFLIKAIVNLKGKGR